MTNERYMVVVAEAQDEVQANIWVDALQQSGIAASTFSRGESAALGGVRGLAPTVYPVLVANDDLGAARNVIAELSGASALGPVQDRDAQRERQLRALISAGVAVAIGLALIAALVVLFN